MRRDLRAIGVAALLACAFGVAVAQSLPEGLRERIGELPSAQRDALYRRAATLQAMDPAQRQAFEQRLAQWKALPEADRRDRRERFQAWQALPPEQRAQLQAAATDFAALPVDRQLDLRQRYAQLDDSQRHGWLLGPALGADWERLQPLLMQVAPAQRLPLLAALRAMTPQQRVDLGVLAQRTPPQDRDRLREALLAVPVANRGAWLVAQLDR